MSLPHTVSEQTSGVEQTPSRWFAEEVQPHEPKLRAWLRARFPSLVDLDDIVQESYARLFRAKGEGKIDQAKPYLYTTARNAALDFFRHERVIVVERIAEIDDLHVLGHGPDTAETVSHGDDLALLAEAMQALPQRCREVLMLRKLQRLSQKEIAQKLGISENTVARHASDGMKRCIQYFRERNVRRSR